jgi:hypothetical protein
VEGIPPDPSLRSPRRRCGLLIKLFGSKEIARGMERSLIRLAHAF